MKIKLLALCLLSGWISSAQADVLPKIVADNDTWALKFACDEKKENGSITEDNLFYKLIHVYSIQKEQAKRIVKMINTIPAETIKVIDCEKASIEYNNTQKK
ncbi:hypothetical protein M8D54_004965 [Salmonella enterica]|nr:hypothetical protein [Salmonella enterica]EGR6194423.1 hypothetical protein [Salmonella enterica]EHR7428491.1 hypothetical protein [Salmonella enterica]EJF2005547.1 hypothetical protein [Salmonella enterica]EJF2493119.1 hypothetical protein [Salmonella enterica]